MNTTPSEPMPPSPPPVAPDPGAGHSEDRNVAMLAHLSGLLLSIVVPLVLWLVYKDQPEKRELVAELKEALNFQLTVLIGYVICWVLAFVLIGLVLFWLLWLVNLVFCIVAAMQVSRTGSYRYPYSLRLVN